MDYNGLKEYILGYLSNSLSHKLIYHTIEHTLYVTECAEQLAECEEVVEHDKIILKTAALLHDIGYVSKYFDNEETAVALSFDILKRFNYLQEDIITISNLILATKTEVVPKGKLEEIIKDSDMFHLSDTNYHKTAENLRVELKNFGKVYTDKSWLMVQIRFFENHHYFTNSAKKICLAKKSKHFKELVNELNGY